MPESSDVHVPTINNITVPSVQPVSTTTDSCYNIDWLIPSKPTIAVISITSIVGCTIGYYLYNRK